MGVRGLAHIGIAVKSIDEWLSYYSDTLGLTLLRTEVVEEQKVRVAFLQVGSTRIELLEPTDEDSPVAKFIEKRGGGVHHIAIEVDDIEEALERHRAAGRRLIDESPRMGAHGTRIAFVHPKATGGLLLELCEYTDLD